MTTPQNIQVVLNSVSYKALSNSFFLSSRTFLPGLFKEFNYYEGASDYL